MSRQKVIRCAACAARIRPQHPHIGVEDLETGEEFSYHARVECQIRAAEETVARVEAGKVYGLRHYHSSTCPDEAPGFGCAGGCFDSPERRKKPVGANRYDSKPEGKTSESVASESGVSKATAERDAEYSRAVDRLTEAFGRDFQAHVLSGESKLGKADVLMLAGRSVALGIRRGAA